MSSSPDRSPTVGTDIMIPTLTSDSTSPAMATSSFVSLAPETRNAIYTLIFESPKSFFIVAAPGTVPRFRLRQRCDSQEYDALRALQVLGLTSRDIRQEVRTFFYAFKHFVILPYGYDYLPIFVHWLDAIRLQCRAVLRNVYFAGYLWYRQTAFDDQQLHVLLRSCTSLRTLVVQINIRHLCESRLLDLDAYLNFEGPDPHDGPLPDIDISTWAETITRLRGLHAIRLAVIMGVDMRREAPNKERSYMHFVYERARVLAQDIERRLRERVHIMDKESCVVVAVRYVGTDERVSQGRPW